MEVAKASFILKGEGIFCLKLYPKLSLKLHILWLYDYVLSKYDNAASPEEVQAT